MKTLSYVIYILILVTLFFILSQFLSGCDSGKKLTQAELYSINYRLRPIEVDLANLEFQVADPPKRLSKGGRKGTHQPPFSVNNLSKEKQIQLSQLCHRMNEGSVKLDKIDSEEDIKPVTWNPHANEEGIRRHKFVYSTIPTIARLQDRDKAKKPRYLLKLFTTMADLEGRTSMHGNTLRVWSDLGDQVLPVVYTEDEASVWAERARTSGWQVRHVPRTKVGLPVLKDMFLDIITSSKDDDDALFYAYANSDILFDESLVTTLLYIARVYKQISYGLFMTGRRTNVPIEMVGGLTSSKQVKDISEKGQEGPPNAEDYFVVTRGAVDWAQIPDFVIGRPGFDNWLVAKARQWGLTVVDASNTVVAVHQTGADGNKAAWESSHDMCVNRRMVTPFDYHPGFTHCTPYLTVTDAVGGVVLLTREYTPSTCTPDPVRAREGGRRGNPCP